MPLKNSVKRRSKLAGFEQETPTCVSCIRKERREVLFNTAKGQPITAHFCLEIGRSLLTTPRGLCNYWKDKHGNTLE